MFAIITHIEERGGIWEPPKCIQPPSVHRNTLIRQRQCYYGKDARFGGHKIWFGIPVLPFTPCVTLNKLLKLSGLQCFQI